ncbi:MAG: NADH-quinone oxidoreductase subunit C [Thermaerobacter sp.]|nr:NADH-quinone oxidoreductase subunit C [Thermaerobacter sp.]
MARDWLQDVIAEHPEIAVAQETNWVRIGLNHDQLVDWIGKLKDDWAFGAMVAEVDPDHKIQLLYLFYGANTPWIGLQVTADEAFLPSISSMVFAADWQEREIEDLYEIRFQGHPQLGNFVLHDEIWPEGMAPMLSSFLNAPGQTPARNGVSHPQIVHAPGAFVMPVGPVYSGVGESIRFHLETVGEEIIFAHLRPFYKYRAIEKLMQGRSPEEVLLIAERIDGLSAFAHSLALAQALEALGPCPVPARADGLRVLWAEWERIRSHVKTLGAILESTGLTVPANLLAAWEEELLQLAAVYTGHRYLFGLNRLGGLARNWTHDEIQTLLEETGRIVGQVLTITEDLTFDNSFLDRLERVGHLSRDLAVTYGLVGPVARASGLQRDLRNWQPYSRYGQLNFRVPVQSEGDGYARFRQFTQEIRESRHLLEQIPETLSGGGVRGSPAPFREGTAVGYCEGPAGAIVYGVWMDRRGHIERCRIITPGLVNWHALPPAVRHFAFQDFPIILASFGLSVADLDR